MIQLPILLIIVFIISLILNYLEFHKKKNAMEIVNDMGIGWNLGNTFECYGDYKEIKIPDDQITLWGNIVPTKQMIVNIKKYGFKTIRIPITWMYFMDSSGKVNLDWMFRIKEVVNWTITENMYCIINIQYDGNEGNWLNKGLKSKEKYIFLWTQIANEFQNFDEHLIFESMDNSPFYVGENYDFETLFILNQLFVDIIRNSGGNNKFRLLIISGANSEIDLTCSSEYKMVNDSFNIIAVSMHYFLPKEFTLEPDDNPWISVIDGVTYIDKPITTWGTENDYNEMFTNFETIKEAFIDKGIPVIITGTSVLTEQRKEQESIREFLFAEFSMSGSYNGIMSCLWDNSKKGSGDMNYYDRENDKWYDEKIGENFIKISKGKYLKLIDFYEVKNIETVTSTTNEGYMKIKIGIRKIINIIFNANIEKDKVIYSGFGVVSYDKNGVFFGDHILAMNGKKEYDGSYTYTLDGTKRDYNDYIEIQKWGGEEYISFNYFSIIFEQNYIIFDYNSYKKSLKYIY